MKVTGTEHVDLPATELFARLSDPERLGEALPAVQAVDAEGGDRFTAAFRPATGLGVTPVRMAFEVTERQAPQRLRVVGNGGAAEFAVHVDAAFELVDRGGATEVHWSVSARLAGVLHSLTQRVLPQIVSDQVAEVLRAAEAGPRPGSGGTTHEDALDADHAEAVAGAGADASTVADPDTYRKGPGW